MSEPKRDYGYLHIITPEDKAKYGPLQVTDEVFKDECLLWDTTAASPDEGFCTNRTYRRKISPTAGFELVPLDEEPKKDDQRGEG